MAGAKGSLLHQPLAIGVGSAALACLAALNVLAFVRGSASPWLLGAVLAADTLIMAVAVFVAAREALVADRRTQTSEARLDSIVDSAMDAIITVDDAQRIVLFNRAAEKLFRCGRKEALGQPLENFIPERFRAAHRQHIEQFARTGATARRMGDATTLWALRADGTEFPIDASISQDGQAGKRYFTVILRDITLRREAEAESARMQSALTGAQGRLAAIVDAAMDPILTIDEEQKIVLCNRAAEQVFQVRREEILGTPLDQLLPARFREGHRSHIDSFGRTGVTSRRMGEPSRLWALRRDGTEFPIEASISQTVEDAKRFFTVILRDVTARNTYEQTLKASQQELRELSARVLEAREDEKTRIARELHDELGQLLTALKMDLTTFGREMREAGVLAALPKVDAMNTLLDRSVSATRRISSDLRPLMLDDLGLSEAARWLVDDFSQRSGVRCEIELAGEEALSEIERKSATVVYRALQESLTNIAKHAGAKNVWVAIGVDQDSVRLEVEDDGRGIATDDLAKTRSLGLKGMRERVAYFGGSVEIARAPRGGTRVRLAMPLGKFQ